MPSPKRKSVNRNPSSAATFSPRPLSRAVAWALVGIAVGTTALPAHALVPLEQEPPVAKTGSEPTPNVVLTVDNSGSMAWDVGGSTCYTTGCSRIEMLKSAAKQAFGKLKDGDIRLAYQSMWKDRGFGPNRYNRTTGVDNSMRVFAGASRTAFNSWLDSLVANNGTPSHAMQFYAGEYLSGKWMGSDGRILAAVPANENPWNKVPGSSATTDQDKLSCRRAVHIFMTDGEWNGEQNNTKIPFAFNSSYGASGILVGADGATRFGSVTPDARLFTSYAGTDTLIGGKKAAPNTDGTATPLPLDEVDNITRQYTPFTTQTKVYSDSIGGTGSNVTYTGTNSNGTTYKISNQPTPSTFSDLAFYYWAKDLQPAMRNDVRTRSAVKVNEVVTDSDGNSATLEPFWNPKNDPARWQHMQTFTIGFGKEATNVPGYDGTFGGAYADYVTGNQSWPDVIWNSNTRASDLWHAALNSRGEFYAVNSGSELQQAFEKILSAAASASASSTTVTASGSQGQLTSGSMVFEASYSIKPVNGKDGWVGKLLALDGQVLSGRTAMTNGIRGKGSRSFLWQSSLGEEGGASIPTSRQIVTSSFNGNVGLSFDKLATLTSTSGGWTSAAVGLTDAQITSLRGQYLHDIMGSMPNFVGPPTTSSSDAGLLGFVASNKSRPSMVYVGANDGMLHGFDAGGGTSASPGTGVEKFAYIPKGVMSNLNLLLGTDYTVNHRYFVNGSPFSGSANDNGTWKTVLAGTLAGGGKGYFLLDATNPAAMTEANASKTVIIDRTLNGTDTSGDADIGNQYHDPVMTESNESAQIVQTNAGWAVVMGNGYNSTNGHPVLLVQMLDAARTLVKIDACKSNATTCAVPSSTTGDTNGLSGPRTVDTDGNGTVDVVYAGDLKGNLWKFDLSASSTSSWQVAFSGSPLFVATSDAASGGKRQPITAAPVAVSFGAGTDKYWVVGFGTGRNITQTDRTDMTGNSFYGVKDDGKSPVSGRGALTLQTQGVLSDSGKGFMIGTSSVTPQKDLKDTGWVYDLPEVRNGNRTKVLTNPVVARGERPEQIAVGFISTNVSSGSGAIDECATTSTSTNQEVSQVNFFDLSTGNNPNVDVNVNGGAMTKPPSGPTPNRLEFKPGVKLLLEIKKKEGDPPQCVGGIGITSTAGDTADMCPVNEEVLPGRSTGWRIVR